MIRIAKIHREKREVEKKRREKKREIKQERFEQLEGAKATRKLNHQYQKITRKIGREWEVLSADRKYYYNRRNGMSKTFRYKAKLKNYFLFLNKEDDKNPTIK